MKSACLIFMVLLRSSRLRRNPTRKFLVECSFKLTLKTVTWLITSRNFAVNWSIQYLLKPTKIDLQWIFLNTKIQTQTKLSLWSNERIDSLTGRLKILSRERIGFRKSLMIITFWDEKFDKLCETEKPSRCERQI